jgi:hypothetical protein
MVVSLTILTPDGVQHTCANTPTAKSRDGGLALCAAALLLDRRNTEQYPLLAESAVWNAIRNKTRDGEGTAIRTTTGTRMGDYITAWPPEVLFMSWSYPPNGKR